MPLDATTRALLRHRHGRKPPPDNRQRWLALTVVVLLHGLFMLLIWHEMRPPAVSTVVHLRLDQSLQLRFVASVPAAAVKPAPAMRPPPAPPSAKEGDERLSMAPARPLAIDPHAPAPPGVEACIAMYRAGQPLAPGCPVDTPDRSVDAELRTRGAGAAGHP
ncbi:MAG: hypothetical protein ACYCZD_04200 [Rhodanobacter sp.]